ncbi:MAG: CsgG/HfaB family protein [Limnochordia bacterium]|jgi:curli biogenesis system outer membrane secretion channel CsgG
MIAVRSRLILSVAILLCLYSAAALAQSPVSVAIMTFKEGQLSNWGWSWNIEEGITNLVIDEITKRDTRISLVERNRIEELLGEQDLAAAGRIEEESASEIGKMLGARLMVMGTITQFDFKQTAGVGISIFRVSGSQAQVKLTGRLVDSQNGRVLASFEGVGNKVGTSFSLDSFKGISIDGEQFQGTTLGEATYAAIKEFVDNLIVEVEKVADQVAKEEAFLAQTGVVVAAIGNDQLVINLGSKHGMKLNTELNITRMQTFPGLSAPVRIPVGTAKVISVDEEASVCVVIQSTQPIQPGDVVGIK